MLIETTEGVINTAHVVKAEISRGQGREGTCLVTTTDGAVFTANVGIEAFVEACGTIVPAASGFTLVRSLPPAAGEDGILYIEEPVIAFRIIPGDPYNGPVPIAAGGEPSAAADGGAWVVRQPNGRCCGPDGEHDTIEEFRADCDRTLAKKREAHRG